MFVLLVIIICFFFCKGIAIQTHRPDKKRLFCSFFTQIRAQKLDGRGIK